MDELAPKLREEQFFWEIVAVSFQENRGPGPWVNATLFVLVIASRYSDCLVLSSHVLVNAYVDAVCGAISHGTLHLHSLCYTCF